MTATSASSWAYLILLLLIYLALPRILLRNDDEEKRNVLLHKIEFITNSGFGISDKYGITKPPEEREDKVRQGGGVRLLPGRCLTLEVREP